MRHRPGTEPINSLANCRYGADGSTTQEAIPLRFLSIRFPCFTISCRLAMRAVEISNHSPVERQLTVPRSLCHGDRRGRGGLRGGRSAAVGNDCLPAQLFSDPRTVARGRGLSARRPFVDRLAVGGLSASLIIPAHSSHRRRDGDANAARPALYHQTSAGHHLARVLVLDVGRTWGDPLNPMLAITKMPARMHSPTMRRTARCRRDRCRHPCIMG